MTQFQKYVVRNDQSVHEALQVIDETGKSFVMVVDGEFRLLGVVTDGDVRRAILRGTGLDVPVDRVMNRRPVVLPKGALRAEALRVMEESGIRQVPVIDEDGRLSGLFLKDIREPAPSRPNRAVIMAGGLGTRLRELTKDKPKPLLPVGRRPILETIVRQLESFGFRHVTMIVNYKAEMIRQHFGDGSHLNVAIDYIEEPKRLGTAGALHLIEGQVHEPFLLMNADLLTKLNVGQLMDNHEQGGYELTICVKEIELPVPYGVVEHEDHRLCEILEKPNMKFKINAGIYVMNPELLAHIPRDEYHDITTFINNLAGNGIAVGCFPIHEYWLDIGQAKDYEQAREDFAAHFDA